MICQIITISTKKNITQVQATQVATTTEVQSRRSHLIGSLINHHVVQTQIQSLGDASYSSLTPITPTLLAQPSLASPNLCKARGKENTQVKTDWSINPKPTKLNARNTVTDAKRDENSWPLTPLNTYYKLQGGWCGVFFLLKGLELTAKVPIDFPALCAARPWLCKQWFGIMGNLKSQRGGARNRGVMWCQGGGVTLLLRMGEGAVGLRGGGQAHGPSWLVQKQ